MFDVFDILVPALSSDARIEVRQQQTAFGPRDDRKVYVGGLWFAEIVPVPDAYTSVGVWKGASERANWTALLAAQAGNLAARSDVDWPRFLDALIVVLSAHPAWLVRCESDCDQHALEDVDGSSDHLVRLLDSHRRTGLRPISFQAVRA